MINKEKSAFQYISIIVVILIHFALFILAQVSNMATENETIKYSIAIIASILLPLIIYLINTKYFNFINLRPPEKLKLNKTLFVKLFIGLFIGLIAVYGTWFINFLNSNDINDLTIGVYLSVIVFNLIPAITEELIFRGTFLFFFIQKKNKYTGLLIISSIFSLIHLGNILMGQEVNMITLFAIFLGGLILGLVYLNFGIVASIATHYIFNILNGSSKSSSEQSISEILILGIVAIILLCIERKIIFPKFISLNKINQDYNRSRSKDS